jgi:hypothetical protein
LNYQKKPNNKKNGAWGLAGRAERLVNLGTYGIIAYNNAL